MGKTYDEIIIDELRKIEPTTIKKLAKALGYNSGNAFWYQLKKLVEKGAVIKDTTKRPYKYTVKEVRDNG